MGRLWVKLHSLLMTLLFIAGSSLFILGCDSAQITADSGGTSNSTNQNSASNTANDVFGISTLGEDFSQVNVGTTNLFTLTVTGSGMATTVLSPQPSFQTGTAINFMGGAYPGTGGTCGSVIPAGGICTIVIAFQPGAPGAFTDQLTVTNAATVPTQSYTLNLSGTAVTPAVLVATNGPTYDTGTQAVNLSTDITIDISNTGGAQATLQSTALAGMVAPFSYKGTGFPGTGGTCATVIAGFGSCTLVVTFAPTSAVVTSEAVTLAYNNGATTQTLAMTLNGTGQNAAIIAITAGPSFTYANTTAGSYTDAVFTVTNSGLGAATSLTADGLGLSAPFSVTGGTFPGTGGTCGASLGIGATCTLVVRFSPTSAATSNGTLTLSFNNGIGPTTAIDNLTGTGITAALLTISDGATFTYPNTTETATATHVFTVTNSGGSTATLTENNFGLGGSIFAVAGGTYPGTGGSCGATLKAFASCSIVVNFTPPSTGAYSDTITLSYNDGANPQTATRPIAGTGLTPAVVTISDAVTYTYADTIATGTTYYIFTVTNSGGSVATLSEDTLGLIGSAFEVRGSFPGTNGTCGTTLASGGATCLIEVGFTPVNATSYTATVTLSYNNGAVATTATRPVAGTGTSPAVLTFSGASPYDFGNVYVGTSPAYTITVTNTGPVSATLGTVTSAGLNLTTPYSLTGGTCATGGTVTASGTCTLIVTFSPTLGGVEVVDPMSLIYNNGGSNQTVQLVLEGTGVSPAFLVISNTPSFSYGTLMSGDTRGSLFTVTNTGSTTATTVVSGGALSSPFSYFGGTFPGSNGTCGATIAASASCTVAVLFAPTSTGSFSTTVQVSYYNGFATQVVSLPVTGTGVASKYPLILAANAGGDSNASASFCTLLTTGAFKCWGSNYNGRLGNDEIIDYGNTPSSYGPNLPVADMGTNTFLLPFTPSALSVGTSHTCVVLDQGIVKCWGDNSQGELGQGDTINRGAGASQMGNSLSAVNLGTGRTATAIAAGDLSTCALLDNNTVRCWGYNNDGELGVGDNIVRGSTPFYLGNNLPLVSLGTGLTARAIAGGTYHYCALLNDNGVKCWGLNSNGQLGQGINTSIGNQSNQMGNSLPEISLGTGRTATAITTGGVHTCAILDNGTLKCWGYNGFGQLGQGSTTNVGDSALEMGDFLPAVSLGSGRTAVKVTAGANHTCVILDNATVKCWGDNATGQLGYGNTSSIGGGFNQMGDNLATVNLGTGRTAVSIVAGYDSTCALLDNNTMKCWGGNSSGQLNLGDSVNRGDSPGSMGDSLSALTW